MIAPSRPVCRSHARSSATCLDPGRIRRSALATVWVSRAQLRETPSLPQVPSNRPDLIAEPRMGRIGRKPSVPGHLVLESHELAWRLDHPNGRYLFQLARKPVGRGENHIAPRDGK